MVGRTRTRTRTKAAKPEPKDPAEGQAERTARYLQRQEQRGLVQVKAWVPADQREALLAYAEELRG